MVAMRRQDEPEPAYAFARAAGSWYSDENAWFMAGLDLATLVFAPLRSTRRVPVDAGPNLGMTHYFVPGAN